MIPSFRKLNFNAGPAVLPEEVLKEASGAIINYKQTGTSILSIPHRGKEFSEILEESKTLVRELCGLNDEYEILWMHGGGRTQFTLVPMNYLGKEDTAGYIDSGNWSSDAIKTALHYGNVQVLASSKESNYKHLPEWPQQISDELRYVHITTNNTIYGTQWNELPASPVPLIADMSSDIFSRDVDYTKCKMFYAVAQKNLGPAGATLVVLHKDMLTRNRRPLPPMMDYAVHASKNSVLNTPAVFPIYVSLLTLRWIKEKGIETIENDNKRKAALLYDEIDRNALFSSSVKKSDRSMMNACFRGADEATEQLFTEFAEENGIVNIKGHRSVGSFRVSLYNAISVKDVQYLIAVMQEFELNYKR